MDIEISEKRYILDKTLGKYFTECRRSSKTSLSWLFLHAAAQIFSFLKKNYLRVRRYHDITSKVFHLPKVPWISEEISSDVIYKRAGKQKNVRGYSCS